MLHNHTSDSSYFNRSDVSEFKYFAAGTFFSGAICSVIPDLDVVGFSFSIKYGDMLGHRGLTHSIFFAVLLGGLVTCLLVDRVGGFSLTTFAFLVLSTLSHGVLDALTNGGLGVGFFLDFRISDIFSPGVRSWFHPSASPVFSPRLVCVCFGVNCDGYGFLAQYFAVLAAR